MEEKVKLPIEKGMTALSGFDYGNECFEKYVKDAYSANDDFIVVVIPEEVRRMGISFVQGFVSQIAKEYGVSNVIKHISVESQNQRIVDKFYNSIEVFKYV